MNISVFYVTFPNMEVARQICGYMVSTKVIACANITPHQSLYFWQGEVHDEPEVAALLKTSPEKAPLVLQCLTERHPYGVPCILQQTVTANTAYAKWVYEQVKPNSHTF